MAVINFHRILRSLRFSTICIVLSDFAMPCSPLASDFMCNHVLKNTFLNAERNTFSRLSSSKKISSPLRFFWLLYLTFTPTQQVFAGDYWEDNAYYCQAPNGYTFPAKNEGGQCGDGDSVLFNGILCASGDQRGCNTVKNSQTTDGEFWRSPRRAQTNNLGKGNSDSGDLPFSDDQNQGVLLYVITTGDTAALQRWLDWIESNRPCSYDLLGTNCTGNPAFYTKGLPRYCGNTNCTLQPLYRDMINEVASHYNLNIPSGIAHYYSIANSVSVGFSTLILQYGLGYLDLSASAKLYLASTLDSSGFPLHLVAVSSLILKKIGNTDATLNGAISTLIAREPNNPFFQYVSQGVTQAVADKVLKYCPSSSHPLASLNDRLDYLWEQANSSQWTIPFTHPSTGTERSMLWDCIMMRNLGPSLYPNYNSAALSAIINFLLEPEVTTTTLTSSASSIGAGASVTFTASVSNTSSTGTVQFLINGISVGSPVSITSGLASLTTTSLNTTGNSSITAVYSGDANYSGSTSVAITLSVLNASTVTVTSSSTSAPAGQSVTLTATVTGSNPTGTIQFLVNGVALGTPVTLTNGVATLTTTGLTTTGANQITSTYSGDGNNIGITSPVFTETVTASTTPVPALPLWGEIIFGFLLLFVALRLRVRQGS